MVQRRISLQPEFSVPIAFTAVLCNCACVPGSVWSTRGSPLCSPVQLSGCDPGKERWEAVEKGLAETASVRGSAFFDMHIMLGFAHGKVTQCAARMALAEDLVKVCHVRVFLCLCVYALCACVRACVRARVCAWLCEVCRTIA